MFAWMALLLALLPACSVPSRQEPRHADHVLPRPDLQGAEPLVARRIETSREGVRSRPGDPGAWGLLGMDLQAHGFTDEAEDCYAAAADLDPGDHRWPYLRAMILAREDPAASLEWFQRAAGLHPGDPVLALRHGSALLAAGKTEPARRRFREAAGSGDTRPWALLGLARLARREGDETSALRMLDQALAELPALGEAHGMRARILTSLGRPAEAELAALAARAHAGPVETPDPLAAEVAARGVGAGDWSARGLRLEREGDAVGAEAAFRRVLSIRRGTVRDHANLAGALVRQDRMDEAFREYRRALELDPRSAFIHNNLAMAWLASGDPGKAVEHLRKAIRLEPSFANAHYNLGIVRARRGDTAGAEASLRRALELEPSHRGALNSLGTALASSGRMDEALALWRRAAAIDPRDLDARYNLAAALSRRGEHREAVDHLEAALKRAPDAPRLLRLLAWELATAPDSATRDGARAVELAAREFARQPGDPRTGDILAAALAEDGQTARAVSMAEKALRAAEAAGQERLAARIGARLELYRSGRPFRQGPAREAARE